MRARGRLTADFMMRAPHHFHRGPRKAFYRGVTIHSPSTHRAQTIRASHVCRVLRRSCLRLWGEVPASQALSVYEDGCLHASMTHVTHVPGRDLHISVMNGCFLFDGRLELHHHHRQTVDIYNGIRPPVLFLLSPVSKSSRRRWKSLTLR